MCEGRREGGGYSNVLVWLALLAQIGQLACFNEAANDSAQVSGQAKNHPLAEPGEFYLLPT